MGKNHIVEVNKTNGTIDFTNADAAILNKWLKADDVAIPGKKYDYLNFV